MKTLFSKKRHQFPNNPIVVVSNASFSFNESTEDMSDANVNKLIIVTQTPPPTKRQYDRTGDFSKRSERDRRLIEEMEHGLRRYEEELWSEESKEVI